MNLEKHTKKDLLELIEKMSVERNRMIEDTEADKRAIRRLEDKVAEALDSRRELVGEYEGRLEKIKTTIAAVCAMKHPGAYLGNYGECYGGIMVEAPQPDPEDLLILKHLYELAG